MNIRDCLKMKSEDQEQWISNIVKDIWGPNAVMATGKLRDTLIKYYEDAFYDGYGAGKYS